MDGERTVVLDVDGTREKAASGPGWRTWCGALLLLAAAAAVCFSVSVMQTKPGETEHIIHSLRQISQTARAAIYLTGTYNRSITTTVQWEEDAGQGFAYGLRLENNQIRIPHTGVYFVYSQATYRLNCTADPEDDGHMLQLSHSIRRKSDAYGRWRPLLSGVRTACRKSPGDRDESWFGAVYLGAAFRLRAHDRLETVMDAKLLPSVEDDEGKTFFGVFAL